MPHIKSVKQIFNQALRYFIVGVFGIFINYCIFLLALNFFKIHYLISGLLGYFLGAIPIFFLNRYWTFKSKVSIFKGFSLYIVINVISVCFHTFAQFISNQYFGVPEIYSQACGISIAIIINFTLTRKLMMSKI